LIILFATIGLNVYLIGIIPKGFFPQQDTGRLSGSARAAQDSSFQAMQQKLKQFVDIVRSDPAVDSAIGFTGSGAGATNTARAFISLKPESERKVTAQQVIDRLRPKLAVVPGATFFMQANQDVRVGGRQA